MSSVRCVSELFHSFKPFHFFELCKSENFKKIKSFDSLKFFQKKIEARNSVVWGDVPFDRSRGGNKHARNVTFPPKHVIYGFWQRCNRSLHFSFFSKFKIGKIQMTGHEKSDRIVATKIDDISGTLTACECAQTGY